MTGGIIWLSFSANQAPCATAPAQDAGRRSRDGRGSGLVLQHDEQAVLAAVELAIEAGVPTKTHILNLLHRLVDGKPLDPPVVTAPKALALTSEPQADLERYDALRRTGEERHAS
jgi:hypothetical protein